MSLTKTDTLYRGRQKRLCGIDNLKFCCAFLVVCIHAPFPGIVGEYITALTRIAVPIFFMISGYFYNQKNLVKQLKKLSVLFLEANAIYFVFEIAIAKMNKGVASFFQELFTIENLVKLVLFNENKLHTHLWYLGAIIYVLLIICGLDKSFNHKINYKKILYYFCPILLMGDLILEKYSLLLWKHEFPYILVRNWLFVGLPYFTIGMFLKEKYDKFQNVSKKAMIIFSIIFTVTTFLERYILVLNNLNTKRDHYLSTTFLSITLFLLFLFYFNSGCSLVSKIGKEASTWIYVLHPIIIKITDKVAIKVELERYYTLVRPVVVFIFTVLLVECIIKVKSLRKANRVNC